MRKLMLTVILAMTVLAGCASIQEQTEEPYSVWEKVDVTEMDEGQPEEEKQIEKETDTKKALRTEEADTEIQVDQPEVIEKESKGLIVLDPGHAAVMSGKTEPIGPGATELKAADSMGTAGVASGLKEYELTLMMCFRLQNELELRGYDVVLTRDRHDLSLTCIERAEVANSAGADLFLRVHADGSESSSANGAMTICITPSSPYHPELYGNSKILSDCILEKFCSITGARNRGVWETDTMTGNNWAEVPTTLIELGFMTNPNEDALMATEDYQILMTQGISNGIDRYFEERIQ